MSLILEFFQGLIARDVVIEFVKLVVYAIFAALLIWRFFKYSEIIAGQLRIVYLLFITAALANVIGNFHFILKYAFATDLSVMNSNIGDMVSCIVLYIFARGKFNQYKNLFNSPQKSFLLLVAILVFFQVICQLRGQGFKHPVYWYWSEYIVCDLFLGMAFFHGLTTLKYDWFSRLVLGFLGLQFLATTIMFFGYIQENVFGLHAFAILELIGNILAVVSSAMLLIANILLLRIKNEKFSS